VKLVTTQGIDLIRKRSKGNGLSICIAFTHVPLLNIDRFTHVLQLEPKALFPSLTTLCLFTSLSTSQIRQICLFPQPWDTEN